MANFDVQNAFLDGIQEIYEELFTTDMKYCFLDDEATKRNFYDESSEKVYKEPITLTAKINTRFEQGDLYVENTRIEAIVSVPTKQLILNNIPKNTDDEIETLRRGKFIYQGREYLVKKVQPKAYVADVWMVYLFYCYVEKPLSLETDSSSLDEGDDDIGTII